jgi:ATP-dependent RNA/DNA helicase IGHMBP2
VNQVGILELNGPRTRLICNMDYFERLTDLLKIERAEDRKAFLRLTEQSSVSQRRAAGLTWYPIAIRGTEMGRGDYLSVEIERTTHHDISHQFRFGVPAVLFSNHDAGADRVEGIITHQSGNRVKITLRTDELPEWSRDGKLGVDVLFDENSYEEMLAGLKEASATALKPDGKLIRILTGTESPAFGSEIQSVDSHGLNASQGEALRKILSAHELAIVHGPPGTGKTTTLIRAIKALADRDKKQILVVAPSNAAVDLLTEKLTDIGLDVLRVGNPARVSTRLSSLTLEERMAEHAMNKEAKKMKKQAAEYKHLAHKYKRNFGKSERDQRKALFDEAHRILKEVNNIEQYIIEDVLTRVQVVAATLIGANHYSVRGLKYHTVVIDEAGQALEPASWVPILKGSKLILAGDHCQLPPTIKSDEAARGGLNLTLMEKCTVLHPDSVVLLEEQYRMNEQIMGYSSQVFYGGKLKANESVARRLLHKDDVPLVFIDTAGCGFEEKLEGTSSTNPEEAAFLIGHLKQLMGDLQKHNANGDIPDVAVISPYKQQINILKNHVDGDPYLMKYGDRISVNTIDSFQGQERDIVYIGLTRSNDNNEIGFLSDVRRMNVAMTRARKKLVVVGDSATLSQLPFYADFVEYAERCGAYHSAWEFMNI